MNDKNYYHILGISPASSAAEVKKAFRRLAKKFHPDTSAGVKKSDERFREITEANDVLSDPEKRKRYDRYGPEWREFEHAGARSGGIDWSKFSGGNNGHTDGAAAPVDGSAKPAEGVNDLFGILFGHQGGRRRTQQGVPRTGEDVETEAIISLTEAYVGTSRLITVNGQTIKVTIKPGVADLQTLRIAGQGSAGTGGGVDGDLYLTVKISPSHQFHRRGNDLQCDLPVLLYTALLGGTVQMAAMNGTVTVHIPKGTPNGKELRLVGLGMPVYASHHEFGHLLVTVRVVLPEALTDEEIALLTALSEIRKKTITPP